VPEWLALLLPVQKVKVLVLEWVWLPELPERMVMEWEPEWVWLPVWPERMVMELGLVREPVSLGQRVKVRELVQE
jgi:hypothetical protein